MADRLEGNDWMGGVVCVVCWTLPCGCSRLTRVLEWIQRKLGHVITQRHRARQRAQAAIQARRLRLARVQARRQLPVVPTKSDDTDDADADCAPRPFAGFDWH